MENKAKIIAVAGKGGVGKTSISASIVRLLVENFPDKKILAIDADPAVGLSVALGVDVKLTLDDIRMSIVDSVENGETREALELLSEARFKIFDALVEMPGFAFLGIGRPESSGCYCKVNSYLKEVIGILANSFDYVVIDGEAGISSSSNSETMASTPPCSSPRAVNLTPLYSNCSPGFGNLILSFSAPAAESFSV